MDNPELNNNEAPNEAANEWADLGEVPYSNPGDLEKNTVNKTWDRVENQSEQEQSVASMVRDEAKGFINDFKNEFMAPDNNEALKFVERVGMVAATPVMAIMGGTKLGIDAIRFSIEKANKNKE